MTTDRLGPGYGHTTPAAQGAEQRAEASGSRRATRYTAEAQAALLAMDGAEPVLFRDTYGPRP
ncbi:hypothetical protein [Nocardia sp. NPDC057455]|uniref:hypothetical protein n=1 Tax=Nocardia sp. NPDC057455 TaxID=3346138 RepID=UPI0036718D3D